MQITDVNTQDVLEKFCDHMEAVSSTIAVDTEFFRRTTYWPKLCLIQIAFDEVLLLIDPLMGSLDLTPLKKIFLSDRIMKIFHSARQDLEIFYALWGEVPRHIMDTQILAMVAGFGESVSYDRLVEGVLGIKLDKSQQDTDWSKRPLSQKQRIYAAGDVFHLHALYQRLCEISGEKKSYIQEELVALESPSLYEPCPEQAWLKIKSREHLRPEGLGVLQKVACVRETWAVQKDQPRSHVIKDEVLIAMARTPTLRISDLERLGVKDERLQKNILHAVQSAEPLFVKKKSSMGSQESLMNFLDILLKAQSYKAGIAQKLIAHRKHLEEFIEDPTSSFLMLGWRKHIFGDVALKAIEGEVALCLDPKTRSIDVIDHSRTET